MKQHYNCIIVEDEPLAAEVLQDYIRQVPFLELKGVCNDAIFAMAMLERQSVDLMFLDIHLPKLKGFDFIKTLKQPPHIIITSAYHEYALQGYEYNVVDYLLKPIEFNRFLMAVNKLRHSPVPEMRISSLVQSSYNAHLFFNVIKKKLTTYLDD